MGNIIIITAPSASGKTTLIKRYMKLHKNTKFAISHTTREKRVDEENGKDYYFVSKKKFKEMIDNNEFIEWAIVHSNYYGTSYLEIEKSKKDDITLILDIDVQGALSLKKKSVEAKYIFIMPPSIEEIERRLLNRNTETKATLNSRISSAKKEVKKSKYFDYIIYNDNLDIAIKNLEKIIEKK